ncbi:MAG: iron-containing alcohol dehydrogenase [Alphaproteobacteria bacterium]|nr:MAG: iron-containing alcohol dehydrogenase [Alphaproteobacteria bacterium]
MKGFEFFYGPKVRSGAGESVRMAELLPPGRCLFVTDAGLVGLGLAEAPLAALREAGVEPVVFDSVEADPSRATVEAAVEAGRGCGSVVGFGGGSPMDVAKLAAYLLGSGDDLDSIWGVGLAKGGRLPLVLVPTTAGTGSEATPVTIITVGGSEKRGVSSAALVADSAVLDPELTVGLPRGVTAATGIDAMVHAIEAYTSAHKKNPLSDLMAREALRLLSANLPNAPVAGVHALAYPLGGHFHVPHGLSNALMLVHVLGHNLHAAMHDYAELGTLLDPALAQVGTQAQAQGFVELMAATCRAAGVPQRLSEVGVGEEHLDLLASEAMKQQRLLVNNPCEIDEAAARRLYGAAL